MCAIAGIWSFGARLPREVPERFTNAMTHRGPDGTDLHEEAQVGLWLGHRRLSILDLSEAGKQPMTCEDGRYWIAFNGEIFNFLELRKELQLSGSTFHSDCDTEVILAAYQQWGPECQLKFNGMWAFAIWDRARQELFLSRDRFGIKPLYYLANDRWFCFASELKAFLHLTGFDARENTAALATMIRNVSAVEPTGETLLTGVRKLLPGHSCLVRKSSVETKRWWNTLDHLPAVPQSFEEQVEHFRELFLDSCRLRLRSDVPVATCLSGGLDSSSVLCSLAELNRQGAEARAAHDWQSAFVASFPGATQDETEFAKAAVAHAGARPHFRQFHQDEIIATLAKVVYDFEEVSTTLPTPVWSIYKSVKEGGATVSLDGHGADELLAGYVGYTSIALRGSGGFLHPRRTIDLVRTFRDLYSDEGPQKPPGNWNLFSESDPILRFIRKQTQSITKRFQRAANPAATHNFRRWVQPHELIATAPPPDIPLRGLNRQLYLDFHYTKLPAILRNFDRCSMAHGVEVRMPFMDWRLVCFLFALPEASKVGGGFTKRILREAMRGILPESIRTRKLKLGFNSPLPEWFSRELRSWLLATLEEKSFLESNLWRGREVRDFVRSRLNSTGLDWAESSHVWTLVHAHLWRKHFLHHR